MNLYSTSIQLSKIAINPLNPRYVGQAEQTQNDLIAETVAKDYAKELLNGMNQHLVWINKIVVTTVDLFCKAYFYDKGKLTGFEYVVLEGNTRTSCLKSGRVRGVGDDYKLPVLLFEPKEYKAPQLLDAFMVLQGVSNVSVVKEWDDVAKVRHIQNMFNTKMELGREVFEARTCVASELGISTNKVTMMLRRYISLRCLGRVNKRSMEANWAFVDAIPKMAYVREMMGVYDDFTYNRKITDFTYGIFYKLIKLAIKQGLDIRTMRDYLTTYFKVSQNLETNPRDLWDRLSKLIEKEEDVAFFMESLTKSKYEEERFWINKMDALLRDFRHFPDEIEISEDFVQKLNTLIISLEQLRDQLT